MQYELSRETRKDPSMTGKIRREYVNRLVSLFQQHASSSKVNTVIDRYLKQAYTAGQIYAAGILRLYKTPFRPIIIDEDWLANLIAQSQISLENINQIQYPDTITVTRLTTPGFMTCFVQGIVDLSRLSGVTNFKFISAASCCNDCAELDGQIIPLDQLESFAPPQHDSCLCVLMPLKGL